MLVKKKTLTLQFSDKPPGSIYVQLWQVQVNHLIYSFSYRTWNTFSRGRMPGLEDYIETTLVSVKQMPKYSSITHKMIKKIYDI